jgi:hypothetical protein
MIYIQWNLSNPTHQGTREMCQIVQDDGIFRFNLVNRNTLGPSIFVRCHRMSGNSGVGLHKFHCIFEKILLELCNELPLYILNRLQIIFKQIN